MKKVVITVRVQVDDATKLRECLNDVCGSPRPHIEHGMQKSFWTHVSGYGPVIMHLDETWFGPVLEVQGAFGSVDEALGKVGLERLECHVQSFALTPGEAWLTRHTLC